MGGIMGGVVLSFGWRGVGVFCAGMQSFQPLRSGRILIR